MTEFSLDLSNNKSTERSDGDGGVNPQVFDPNNAVKGLDQRFMEAAAVSPSPRPRTLRKNSSDFHATNDAAHFLRACALCKRRLIPGRDIYMYRYKLNYLVKCVCARACVFLYFFGVHIHLWGRNS